MLGLIPIGAVSEFCASLDPLTPLPILGFFPVAVMIGATLLFLRTLGVLRVLGFWVVFAICVLLRLIPFPGMIFASLTAQTIVALVYLIRARASA